MLSSTDTKYLLKLLLSDITNGGYHTEEENQRYHRLKKYFEAQQQVSVEPVVKPTNDVIKIIGEFIERDKKLAEIFDNDDWHCSKAYNEAYSSRVTIVLNELKNRLSI